MAGSRWLANGGRSLSIMMGLGIPGLASAETLPTMNYPAMIKECAKDAPSKSFQGNWANAQFEAKSIPVSAAARLNGITEQTRVITRIPTRLPGTAWDMSTYTFLFETKAGHTKLYQSSVFGLNAIDPQAWSCTFEHGVRAKGQLTSSLGNRN